MTGWPRVALRDLCARISSGGTPSRAHPEYFSLTSGHPWLKSQELLDGRISSTEERITDLGLANSSAKYHPRDTIVMAMYGANVGQLGFLAVPATVNQAVCGLRVDPARANFRYVFYALLCLRKALTVQAMGAAQQNLNQELIRNFTIPVPDLRLQMRIAAILSAYDDLIENNSRRIQILEEMAQAIYREWFVEFRFPGHEGVRMVDSELGPIPCGWRARRLAEVAKIVMGQSPPSGFYNKAGDGLPFHQGVTNFGRHFPTHSVFSVSGDRRAETGDILFSVRAPVGRINVSDSALILGRGLCAIRAPAEAAMFVLFQLKHLFQVEDIIGGGSIFNAVKRSDVENLPVLWPDDRLLIRYRELAGPMFSLIRNLTSSNVSLRRARDLLLPRLISGEIDVSDLHVRDAEPAA